MVSSLQNGFKVEDKTKIETNVASAAEWFLKVRVILDHNEMI